MILGEVITGILNPALRLLPARLDSDEARMMLLAIGQQESRFKFRRQLGDGPARGFWQFEKGTRASRGGVWGVYLHESSNYLLQGVCEARGCIFDPASIWTRLEVDDILACCVARLLLLTNPKPLPDPDDSSGAWDYYLNTWRPGKPHHQTWDAFHDAAAIAMGRGL